MSKNDMYYVQLSEDGFWTAMSATEVARALNEMTILHLMSEEGLVYQVTDAGLDLIEDTSVGEGTWEDSWGNPEASVSGQYTMSDDYLHLVDSTETYRSWEDDAQLDYRSDFKYPFQKGYTPDQSHLKNEALGIEGPGSWL